MPESAKQERKPRGSPETDTIGLAVSPHGQFYLFDDDSTVPPSTGQRIAREFQIGVGAGLLALAGRELTTDLPASLSFGREVARAYLHALCTRDEDSEDLPLPADDRALTSLADSVPPMRGAEYVSADVLRDAWQTIDTHVVEVRGEFAGNLQQFVQSLHPGWHTVGRVTFHLAEQKGNERHPFAFIATYTEGLSQQGRTKHIPLARALQAHKDDRSTLLNLLRPVEAAARNSEFIAALSQSRAIYRPLGWTPAQAWQFMRDVPACQAAGVLVRLPDWWHKRTRPRAVGTLGTSMPSRVGLGALLDFRIGLMLDGKRLSVKDQKEILKGTAGLRWIKGRWVEVDPSQLQQAMDHLSAVSQGSQGGVTLHEGMRLLAGWSESAATPLSDDNSDREQGWVGIEAGAWLSDLLERLSDRDDATDQLDPQLHAELRPYQRVGVRWLSRIVSFGLGGCLADDMGLGKTIQVIATLLRLKREGFKGPHLLVVPTSLLANWRDELTRFAPSLRPKIAHRSEMLVDDIEKLGRSKLANVDLLITTYGSVPRQEWLTKHEFGLIVIDEAQAIKNPGTRQTRAIKRLTGRARIALTGTPVENRLGDLWSIFDFLCPSLLGTAQSFKQFQKRIEAGDPRSHAPVRRVLKPYLLRRLKTDKSVISDLPDKTEVDVFCGLTRKQAALYGEGVEELAKILETVDGMARRGVVLSFLMRFKQICNHPSQWLGDGQYSPDDSDKFARLRELVEPMRDRQEKVLVFTQFREMTGPLSNLLESVFGRSGLVLHGQTAVKQRQALVDRFQREEGPPFFVLSLKAGGTGLNLTEASHVIHFDRWWNPAVENQATDRAFRIGQRRNVLVHRFVVRGTVEERISEMLDDKRKLAGEIITSSGGDALLTEMKSDELVSLVSLDLNRALQGG